MASEPTELTVKPPSAPVQVHHVQFWLNLHTGLWRGACSCGWQWVCSDRDALNTRAAAHDLAEGDAA